MQRVSDCDRRNLFQGTHLLCLVLKVLDLEDALIVEAEAEQDVQKLEPEIFEEHGAGQTSIH